MKIIAAFLSTMLLGGAALASTVTVNNNYSGWYDAFGNHTAANENYLAGYLFHPFHNFFDFSLTGVTGTVTSATFNVSSYGIVGSGTYTLYATNLGPGINADCSACFGTFNGLVSGAAIGSIAYTVADQSTVLHIALNSAGLSWLTANEGGNIVLGGDSPQPGPNAAFIFGGSVFTPSNSLDIATSAQVIPEPTSVLLFGSGILGIAAALRRKVML